MMTAELFTCVDCGGQMTKPMAPGIYPCPHCNAMVDFTEPPPAPIPLAVPRSGPRVRSKPSNPLPSIIWAVATAVLSFGLGTLLLLGGSMDAGLFHFAFGFPSILTTPIFAMVVVVTQHPGQKAVIQHAAFLVVFFVMAMVFAPLIWLFVASACSMACFVAVATTRTV